jgi:hypothetical protein
MRDQVRNQMQQFSRVSPIHYERGGQTGAGNQRESLPPDKRTLKAWRNGPSTPCCLHISPCSYGWMDRWDNIVNFRRLVTENATDEKRVTTRLSGEAIQAIATTSAVRLLLDQGCLSEASLVNWPVSARLGNF